MAHNMTREQFEAQSKAQMEERFPESKVEIRELTNSRCTYQGMTVIPSEKKSHVSPVINMDMFWNRYEAGDEFDDIFEEMVKVLDIKPDFSTDDFVNNIKSYDGYVKNHLFVALCNADKRREDVIGQYREDLFLEVRVMVNSDDNGMASAAATKDMLDLWGKTEDEVVADAIYNSSAILPAEITDMGKLLNQLMDEDVDVPEDSGMIVVTNKYKTKGASVLFYEGVFEQLSKQFGGDFYLFPSSKNEWICVGKEYFGDVESMRAMVRDINSAMVEAEDWLSDEVYKYDSEAEKFLVMA